MTTHARARTHARTHTHAHTHAHVHTCSIDKKFLGEGDVVEGVWHFPAGGVLVGAHASPAEIRLFLREVLWRERGGGRGNLSGFKTCRK